MDAWVSGEIRKLVWMEAVESLEWAIVVYDCSTAMARVRRLYRDVSS